MEICGGQSKNLGEIECAASIRRLNLIANGIDAAFPISQFVQYHAVELWQRPDGALVKQRLGSVPSIYTPVMLEEMARQEPPPATPVLGEPH